MDSTAGADDHEALLKEYQDLLQMLSGAGPEAPRVPEEIQEIMANVKRAKGQQAAAEQQPSQEVTPQPGYVIKTTDDQGRKVFINICHSSQVPIPSSWEEGMAPEKVLRALEDLQRDTPNQDTEAMKFSISVSEMQHDTDKQGQPCITVDAIVNSEVMRNVQASRPVKAFVNELLVGFVGQKHKLTLDPKYKLPKMAYKGKEIRSQTVKVEPKPLVSDVTSTRDNGGVVDDDEAPSFPLVPSKAVAAAKKKAKQAAAAAAAGGGSSSAAAGAAASSSWQHDVKCEGRPVTHMVVSVQLPTPTSNSSVDSRSWSAESVQVQLCGTQLRVQVGDQQQQQQQQQQQGPTAMCIHLPFAASSEGAEAELRSTSTGSSSSGSNKGQQPQQQLVVRLPYLPLQQWVSQLVAEAPHSFNQLPVAHQAYMELDD